MNFLSRNAGVVALIALVIAIGGYFYPQSSGHFGQIKDTSYFDYFDATTGYKLSGTTFFSNTSGTTTAAIGCIQANATSSATTIKLIPSVTGATSTFSGTVYWAYGTCP